MPFGIIEKMYHSPCDNRVDNKAHDEVANRMGYLEVFDAKKMLTEIVHIQSFAMGKEYEGGGDCLSDGVGRRMGDSLSDLHKSFLENAGMDGRVRHGLANAVLAES